jgi:hypothetical protein
MHIVAPDVGASAGFMECCGGAINESSAAPLRLPRKPALQEWELKLVLDFEFIITKMRNLKQLKEMEVSDSY